MSFKGKLTCSLSFKELLDPSTAEALTRNLAFGATEISIDNGTGDFQATKGWAYRGSLAATSITFDTTALPLPNVAGSGTGSPLLALTKGKLIYAYSESLVDGQILYMGNAATPFSAWTDVATAREIIMPGSPCLKTNLYAQGTAPWTVDSTHKLIKFENAATFIFRFLIIGV